jgi:tight adherence protein B
MGAIRLSPQDFLQIVVLVSVFGLVLSLWMIWLVAWLFRRGQRSKHVLKRLGALEDPGAAAGRQGERVLRLWRDGREVTTTVPGQIRENPILKWLRRTHEDAGYEAPLGSMLLGVLSIMAVVFMLSLAVSHSFWISTAAALVAIQIFWITVTQRIARRASLFERQLVDSLELAARSLRAGHPLTGAFRLISEEIPAPVGNIFAEVVQHQGLGSSLEQAMRAAAVACPSSDFKLFATSIVIQLRSGGNLAEMMERLAYVIRERMRLARRVRVLTAQTQFSKRILLTLPVVIFVILNMLNPEYMHPLYATSPGQKILFIAASGLLIGSWMMNKLSVLKQ